jgi:protein-disulfide isomerase
VASRKEQREEARRQREEREAEEHRKQTQKKRLWQIGGALVAIVAIVIVAIAVSSSGGEDQKVEAAETENTQSLFTGIDQDGVTLGDPDAPVTIYEFADLQCPFCKQYAESVFPQLVEKYVKTGEVKMVFRNLTFLGPDSVTAARAAAAAGEQDKLWDFQDLFYKNQGTENTGYVTDAFIEDIAKAAGLDVDKLMEDMNAPVVEQQLGEAQQQAQEFGVNSTPSFLIQVGDGRPQQLNYEQFDLQEFSGPIDQAIADAKGN